MLGMSGRSIRLKRKFYFMMYLFHLIRLINDCSNEKFQRCWADFCLAFLQSSFSSPSIPNNPFHETIHDLPTFLILIIFFAPFYKPWGCGGFFSWKFCKTCFLSSWITGNWQGTSGGSYEILENNFHFLVLLLSHKANWCLQLQCISKLLC